MTTAKVLATGVLALALALPASSAEAAVKTVKVDAVFSMNDGTHGDPSDFIRQVGVRYG